MASLAELALPTRPAAALCLLAHARQALTAQQFATERPAFANDYKDKIYSVFNAALSQYAFTPYTYLPPKLRPYLRDLSPTIDSARLQVDQNQLRLRVAMSATLTKATADEALKNATSGWTVDDIINFLKNHFAGPRTS